MEEKTKTKDLEERTYKFAIDVIRIVNLFPQKTAAYILGKQIIRSGTSINSNIIHAKNSLSKKEFTYYLNNAKREAKETKSWLLMIVDSDLISLGKIQSLIDENEELIRILVASVKTSQNK
ncbi:MAG: four helix bundle protein [Patescibacteria group bacterium]|nr:four helix bundle protein [Patescibacteria group bacterium]